MPMKKQEEYAPKLPLQGWNSGEKRIVKFLNDGQDYTSEDYGLAYVYQVEYEGEKKSLWIRPKSPLQIGLQAIVNKYEKLEGLTIAITKETGKKQSDTRYKCEVI